MTVLLIVPVGDRARSCSLADCSPHTFFVTGCSFLAVETGWDLGSFAAALHLDTSP